MTTREAAAAMRRLADVFDKLPSSKMKEAPKDQLEGDFAAGAASMVCYLRDLFTVGDRDQYNRSDILVILETVSRDAELFPLGIGKLMWDAEVDELPDA